MATHLNMTRTMKSPDMDPSIQRVGEKGSPSPQAVCDAIYHCLMTAWQTRRRWITVNLCSSCKSDVIVNIIIPYLATTVKKKTEAAIFAYVTSMFIDSNIQAMCLCASVLASTVSHIIGYLCWDIRYFLCCLCVWCVSAREGLGTFVFKYCQFRR